MPEEVLREKKTATLNVTFILGWHYMSFTRLFLNIKNKVIINVSVFFTVGLVVILTLAFGVQTKKNVRFGNTKKQVMLQYAAL
jgi:hypothetical protein